MARDAEIYVDADAMPRDALHTIFQAGRKHGVKVVTVSSINHHIDSEHHVTVDASPQATDMKIVSLIRKGVPTLVVTQDYGLAALVLAKGCSVVSQNGMEYTDANIDRLLLERTIHAHERKVSGRNKGPKARTETQRTAFARTLEAVLVHLLRD